MDSFSESTMHDFFDVLEKLNIPRPLHRSVMDAIEHLVVRAVEQYLFPTEVRLNPFHYSKLLKEFNQMHRGPTVQHGFAAIAIMTVAGQLAIRVDSTIASIKLV